MFGSPLRHSLLALCGTLALAAAALAQPAGAAAGGLPSSAVLGAIPAGAREVRAAAAAKAGDRITLRGRIPMSKDAFDPARAVFTMVDDVAATGCCPRDGTLADTCRLGSEMKARVQFVDSANSPLAVGLEGKHGLRPGAEVFVTGAVVTKDPLVLNATGVHAPAVPLPIGLLSSESPKDARNVSEVKKAGGLKKGETVALRGLVGGSKSPFVGGRAMFTLVGDAIKPCNANPDDKCRTPWDYCCDPKTEITANSATIRVVDAQGNPLKLDLKGRAGIRELSDIVVLGTVSMSDKGSLIVDARTIRVITP